MVGERVRELASRIHRTSVAAGFEELSRLTRTARSVFYVRQREISFRPNIAYAAFGLMHAHLFVTSEDSWLSSPFAVERYWTVTGPGVRVLYVHLLLPADRARDVPGAVLTGDVIQEFAGITPPARPHPLPVPADPFIVPVSLAALGGKPSLQRLWDDIHEHLGERVWSYLPRERRLRRNGKRYVRRSFRLLNEHCLVSQHVVRVPSIERALVTLFVMADALLLAQVRARAMSIEYYPADEGYLVRAVGGIDLLKSVSCSDAPWWILDEERSSLAPRVRCRFEDMHEPRGWRS